MKAYKLTNKVTCARVFVAADSVEAAFDEMAKSLGASNFEALTDDAHGKPLPKSLFAVSSGYWKSNTLRGRFPSEGATIAACAKKGVEPRFVQFWHVQSEQ